MDLFFFVHYNKKKISISHATDQEILFLSVSNMQDLDAFISHYNRQRKIISHATDW